MDETCKLDHALGETRACPRETCGLWEDGGRVLEAGCAITRLGLDLSGRQDLAEWLIGLRRKLELARDAGRTAG